MGQLLIESKRFNGSLGETVDEVFLIKDANDIIGHHLYYEGSIQYVKIFIDGLSEPTILKVNHNTFLSKLKESEKED